MKKLFVFATVKSLVSPAGTASLKTTLKKAGDNTLLPNAKVTIQMEGGVAMEAISGEDGTTVHDNINPGVYNCKVEAVGMPAITFVKEVNTGTAARKEVFV